MKAHVCALHCLWSALSSGVYPGVSPQGLPSEGTLRAGTGSCLALLVERWDTVSPIPGLVPTLDSEWFEPDRLTVDVS